ELEFGLGSHSYRVERGLNNAELYQNGVVVANSLKEVTGRLQRVLGMTHDEFFNTYFTGQKELAVLPDATRPERAAFLSRVLRHEELTLAQERIRERRNALGHEVDGLETGLPPQAELEKGDKTAETQLAEARKAATVATAERTKTQQALAAEEPRWQQWVERRERTLSLHGDLRVAEAGGGGARGRSRGTATCAWRSREWWSPARNFNGSTRSWPRRWPRARSCASSKARSPRSRS